MSSGENGAKVGDGIIWSLNGSVTLDWCLMYEAECLGAAP